ncbi:MAG: hypothetical protein EA381_04170 [Planctomycetaceae bacterium]|nr:MAG: hypothetical protein EA381_04170 [Planctomycetaceae bacterium]
MDADTGHRTETRGPGVETGQDAADWLVPLERLTREDLPCVGGKNASLGELLGALADAGVRVAIVR